MFTISQWMTPYIYLGHGLSGEIGIPLLDTDNGYHAINNGTLTGNSVHDSTYNELKRRFVDLLTSFQESDLTQEQKPNWFN